MVVSTGEGMGRVRGGRPLGDEMEWADRGWKKAVGKKGGGRSRRRMESESCSRSEANACLVAVAFALALALAPALLASLLSPSSRCIPCSPPHSLPRAPLPSTLSFLLLFPRRLPSSSSSHCSFLFSDFFFLLSLLSSPSLYPPSPILQLPSVLHSSPAHCLSNLTPQQIATSPKPIKPSSNSTSSTSTSSSPASVPSPTRPPSPPSRAAPLPPSPRPTRPSSSPISSPSPRTR